MRGAIYRPEQMKIPRSTPYRSGPGLLYALRGPLAAYVRRFWAREYRDSHKGAKRRDGPLNGLCGGFVFWPLPCPAGHGRKNAACGLWTVYKRREVAGEYRDAGGRAGRNIGRKKYRPRQSQGGKLSRFFRRLPDHHKREKDNK